VLDDSPHSDEDIIKENIKCKSQREVQKCHSIARILERPSQQFKYSGIEAEETVIIFKE